MTTTHRFNAEAEKEAESKKSRKVVGELRKERRENFDWHDRL